MYNNAFRTQTSTWEWERERDCIIMKIICRYSMFVCIVPTCIRSNDANIKLDEAFFLILTLFSTLKTACLSVYTHLIFNSILLCTGQWYNYNNMKKHEKTGTFNYWCDMICKKIWWCCFFSSFFWWYTLCVLC